MKNDDTGGCMFLIVIALIFAAFIGGYLSGSESLETDAVKSGHAEYYLDKVNNRKWRWLAPCGEKESTND